MFYCADCSYLDYKMCEYGKYRCSRKYEYRYADDKECIYFCENKYSSDLEIKYRSEREKKDAINNSIKSRNGGCYITTIIVDTLNLGDNNYSLNIIRNFRNNYLQKDNKYKILLLDYDLLGPIIANSIRNDKNKLNVCQNMYNLYIIAITNDIENNKYDDAIIKYVNMTEILRLYYSINNIDINNEYDNYDINNLGHGKIRILNKD